MKTLIRKLSAPGEFVLVLLLWMGITIVSRAVMLVGKLRHSPNWTETTPLRVLNSSVLGTAVFELLILAAVLWIGRIRGWSLKSFGLRPAWKWTAVGILLFFAVGYSARLLGLIMGPSVPSALSSRVVSELTLPFILLIATVNPVFEESLWAGYFVHALKRYGMWPTVLASTLVRTFCHAHLGMRALVSILPQGIIYGLVYWRWRQLWPLVVAHSLQMFFSLMGPLFIGAEPDSQKSYEVSWQLFGAAAFLICLFMAWRNREKGLGTDATHKMSGSA